MNPPIVDMGMIDFGTPVEILNGYGNIAAQGVIVGYAGARNTVTQQIEPMYIVKLMGPSVAYYVEGFNRQLAISQIVCHRDSVRANVNPDSMTRAYLAGAVNSQEYDNYLKSITDPRD